MTCLTYRRENDFQSEKVKHNKHGLVYKDPGTFGRGEVIALRNPGPSAGHMCAAEQHASSLV